MTTAGAPGDNTQLPTVFIVNGKSLLRNDADNLVTLWNIEDLKVLVCGDARLKVRYLIYKIQKRYRPHLEGNVAGYGWTARTEAEARDWKHTKHLPPFIERYILRETYDSLRRVTGAKSILDNRIGRAWNTLPRDVLYLLDGKPIKSDALAFLDGLVIKSLDFVPPRKAVRAYGERARNGAVVATLFKDRMPMILFDDTPIRFSTWLRFCTASQISMDSRINYRFISPVEATARYGKKGRYGCIYVRTE